MNNRASAGHITALVAAFSFAIGFAPPVAHIATAQNTTEQIKPLRSEYRVSIKRVELSDVTRLRSLNADVQESRDDLRHLAIAWSSKPLRKGGNFVSTPDSRAAYSAFEEGAVRYRKAAAVRDTHVDRVLQKIELGRGDSQVQLVAEYLLLSAELLQQDLIAALGGSLRTEVPSLIASSVNDIVADQLLLRYARAVTYPAASADTNSSVELLAAFMRELALLSTRQVALLDRRLDEASQRVHARLEGAGLQELTYRHIWMMAPIHLLVFDVCKHFGERCRAYSWFVRHRVALLQEIERNGWPTDAVYLYNRSTGALDGHFLASNDGTLNRFDSKYRRYIDPRALLTSLADPRAIGLGQCGLSGMVGRGAAWLLPRTAASGAPTPGALPSTQLPNVKAYSCPAFSCGTAGISGSPVNAQYFGSPLASGSSNGQRTAFTDALLRARWSDLTDLDVSQMKGDLCALGTGQNQGLLPSADDPTNCLADQLLGNDDPHDTYLGCIAEAVGAGTQTVFDLQSTNGVPPPSPECRAQGLADGGGGAGAAAADDWDIIDLLDEVDKGNITESEAMELLRQRSARNEDVGAAPGTGSGTDAPADPENVDELQPSPTPPEEIRVVAADAMCAASIDCLEGVLLVIDKQLGAARAEVDQEKEKYWKSGRDFVSNILDDLKKRSRGAGGQMCVDPLNCDSSCSGLGRQVAEVAQCTQDFVDSLLKAAGLPSRGVPQTPWRDPRTILPNPEAVDYSESDLGACLPSAGNTTAGGGTWRSSGICGLVLCPEGSPVDPNGCCGASSSMVGRALVDPLCHSIRCMPNPETGEGCECDGLGSGSNYTSMPPDSFSLISNGLP